MCRSSTICEERWWARQQPSAATADVPTHHLCRLWATTTCILRMPSPFEANIDSRSWQTYHHSRAGQTPLVPGAPQHSLSLLCMIWYTTSWLERQNPHMKNKAGTLTSCGWSRLFSKFVIYVVNINNITLYFEAILAANASLTLSRAVFNFASVEVALLSSNVRAVSPSHVSCDSTRVCPPIFREYFFELSEWHSEPKFWVSRRMHAWVKT